MNRRRSTIAIALGSNIGDRQAHLDFALRRLTGIFGPLRTSSVHETAPSGVTVSQPHFLNMAVTAATSLPAEATLAQLLAIEHEAGRERPFPGAPRTLDLDLILHGSTIVDRPDLVVPHPRFRERLFVLEPLSEIAARLRDPVSGKTIAALLADARGAQRQIT